MDSCCIWLNQHTQGHSRTSKDLRRRWQRFVVAAGPGWAHQASKVRQRLPERDVLQIEVKPHILTNKEIYGDLRSNKKRTKWDKQSHKKHLRKERQQINLVNFGKTKVLAGVQKRYEAAIAHSTSKKVKGAARRCDTCKERRNLIHKMSSWKTALETVFHAQEDQ